MFNINQTSKFNPRRPSMRRWFYSIFALFFVAIIGVEVCVHVKIDATQRRSTEAERLQIDSLMVLEQLNDYISDFRIVESEALTPMSAKAFADTLTAAAEFDNKIKVMVDRYRTLVTHEESRVLLSKFQVQWNQYRRASNQVLQHAKNGKITDAARLYRGDSLAKYAKANNTFGALVFRSTEVMIKEVETRNKLARTSLLQIDILFATVLFLMLGCLSYVDMSVLRPLARIVNGLRVGMRTLYMPWLVRSDEIGVISRCLVEFQENNASLARDRKLVAAKNTILLMALANQERLNGFQRAFQSMATHEFRTLLNVIDGHAQRLLGSGVGDSDSSVRYMKIREAVTKLNALIGNWLDASQSASLEDPKFGRKIEFDIVTLVEEVRGIGMDMFPGAKITILTTQELNGRIIGDSNVLFHALINLVTNAAKYTMATPVIQIFVSDIGESLCIELSDNGVGIPNNELTDIFKLSFRSRSSSTLGDGKGIGLAIVQAAIDFHNGTIEVTSIVGVGTTFKITLPRGPRLSG